MRVLILLALAAGPVPARPLPTIGFLVGFPQLPWPWA
jgi:hypothetical protein